MLHMILTVIDTLSFFITIIFLLGIFAKHSVGQTIATADSVQYYEAVMKNTNDPIDFETARKWLNHYYRDLVINDEAKVPDYELKDPLKTKNSSLVQDKETWLSTRRPEIINLFEQYVYGKVPEFNYDLKFHTLSVDSKALGGMATRKQISILFKGYPELSIDLLIYLPNHIQEPVPAMMGLNFFGNMTIHPDEGIIISEKWMRPNPEFGIVDNRATEDTRGVYSERWQVEKLLQRGYALVTAYAGDIEPDEHNRMNQGVRSLAYKEQDEPASDEWGTIAAWAWGLSRMMDYLETDDDIDQDRIGLFGHSRLGKAALWAGALDERFSVVISNNSGSGGAALSARKFGETIGVINTSFPHWFCKNYSQFNNKEENLPLDQHMLLSLIAPRPLYVASSEDDLWADPLGEFISALEASPVYKLFGLEGLPVQSQPEINSPVSGTIGYHIRDGGHGVTSYDWDNYLNFTNQFFK